MKVVATETGFFKGSRIREGTVFEVPDGTKGKWFIPVNKPDDRNANKPKEKSVDAYSDMLGVDQVLVEKSKPAHKA